MEATVRMEDTLPNGDMICIVGVRSWTSFPGENSWISASIVLRLDLLVQSNHLFVDDRRWKCKDRSRPMIVLWYWYETQTVDPLWRFWLALEVHGEEWYEWTGAGPLLLIVHLSTAEESGLFLVDHCEEYSLPIRHGELEYKVRSWVIAAQCQERVSEGIRMLRGFKHSVSMQAHDS